MILYLCTDELRTKNKPRGVIPQNCTTHRRKSGKNRHVNQPHRGKYRIGQYIFEEELQGEERAQYGKQVLQSLSPKLTEHFGIGWSYSNLRQNRQFYLAYSNLTATGYQIEDSTPNFSLSWSHYLLLMRVENLDARKFYEIECTQQQWSKRQLSRQIGSSLYERLALSRDKEGVMRLAQEGQVISKPEDIIKDPITLEFLGLKSNVVYSESKLEHAIIR